MLYMFVAIQVRFIVLFVYPELLMFVGAVAMGTFDSFNMGLSGVFLCKLRKLTPEVRAMLNNQLEYFLIIGRSYGGQ